MATNPYFRKSVPSEQALVESLTIEAIKINGHDFLYIPRETVTSDPLLGDQISKYTDANRIEMYFDSPASGFSPSPPSTGDLISRFGLEIPDAGVFIVSQRRFKEVMSHNTAISNLGRPREGDLIYFDYASALFEIKFVEDEMPFYPLGLQSIFQLSCQRYVYSGEEISTGETDLDRGAVVASDYLRVLTLGVTQGAGTNYTVGERVYSGTTAAPSADGKSTDWNLASKLLTVVVHSQTGEFVVGGVVTGETSGTSWTIVGISNSDTRTGNESSQDNSEIDLETNRDSIFDFSEKDPFSEGNY